MFPQRLINGYNDFLTGRLEKERGLYKQLGERGQVPEIMIISCGDSRVAPEVIFNLGPGEAFVLRNIANLVPPDESHKQQDTLHGVSAAIEYANNALAVRHIVVLGHANCGGIRAYANQIQPLSKSDFIGRWMSQIEPVIQRCGPRPTDPDEEALWLRKIELGTIEHSLSNLLSFPAVKARVERGELHLHGAYFGISTGRLYLLDSESQSFIPCIESIDSIRST